MIKYSDWKSKEKIIEIYEESESHEKTIRPNDIKEGAVIYQYNGWYGEVLDNAKGIRRVVNVHGHFTEAGSIFVWDISTCVQNGEMFKIELPPKYRKQYKQFLEMYGYK